MEPGKDNSLIHVVNHLKYCLKHNDPKYFLILQYKLAKPAEPTQGNKKFQQFLQDSHQFIIVMNANRQKKRNDYVHLKSDTSAKDFYSFRKNLETLHKIHQTQTRLCQKIDLTTAGQKISFDSETQKWSYKSKRLLFRPNYQTVKKGKLFRISLTSQAKGEKEPRRKVVHLLEQSISQVLQSCKPAGQDIICGPNTKLEQKKPETTTKQINTKVQIGQENKKQVQPALRFKKQEKIVLNDICSIVMSKVYQSINIKLYKSIQELVGARKNSSNDLIGKLLLSEMVQQLFEQLKEDLTYEVEMRFNPQFLKQIENEDEEDIYHKMEIAADVFAALSKDPNQFSAEQIVHLFDLISKK